MTYEHLRLKLQSWSPWRLISILSFYPGPIATCATFPVFLFTISIPYRVNVIVSSNAKLFVLLTYR